MPKKIQKDLGIHVLRHGKKKPGGIEAVVDYFGCDPDKLVMIGDRILTDIVFGNRYGMLTIHTAYLTEEGDNKAAAKIRRKEIPMIKKWVNEGVRAPDHKLYRSDICYKSLFTTF